jgi:hypothetical protein
LLCQRWNTNTDMDFSTLCQSGSLLCIKIHLFRLSILISKFQILIGIIAELQIIKGFLL